jgi:hypothetical protein
VSPTSNTGSPAAAQRDTQLNKRHNDGIQEMVAKAACKQIVTVLSVHTMTDCRQPPTQNMPQRPQYRSWFELCRHYLLSISMVLASMADALRLARTLLLLHANQPL